MRVPTLTLPSCCLTPHTLKVLEEELTAVLHDLEDEPGLDSLCKALKEIQEMREYLG